MDWKVLFDSTLLVTAAVYGALFSIAWSAGLLGIWLLVLLTLSAWRYAYAVLRYTAQGKSSIPAPDIESMNPVGELMLVFHFIAFPAVLAAIALIAPFGHAGIGAVLDFAIAAIVVVAFPASAALMGFTRNIAVALSPTSIWSMIVSMGRAYYVLVGACVALVLLTLVVRDLLLSSQLPLIGIPLAMLETWAWLAMFASIGSAIHAHADVFDVPGMHSTPEERAADERRAHWRSALDLAYAAMRSGHLREGFDTIKRLVAENEHSREIQFWLFEQMIRWDDRSPALRVAARLIEQLVAEDDTATAFELLMRCRRVGRIEVGAATRRELAAFAAAHGQPAAAAELGG